MGLSVDKGKYAVNVSVLPRAVLPTVVINPRVRYDSSPGWTWAEEQKRKELSSSSAKYLYIVSHNNQLVAFAHFRFVLEESLSTGKSAALYWCSFLYSVLHTVADQSGLAMSSRWVGASKALG